MKLNPYKQAMCEIPVKYYEPYELEDRLAAKSRRTKWLASCVFIGVLIISAVLFYDYPGKVSDITIIVQAAEKEVTLTNDFIDFQLNADPLVGGANSDQTGFINYNLQFVCEGDHIKSLTYTCSDQLITVDNRFRADAYYVENLTMPVEEFKNQKSGRIDNFLFGYFGEDEEFAHVTRLVGNSFTVSYEDQANQQYGLVVAANIDDQGNYQAKDIVIKLDILLEDNSVIHKEIQLKPDQKDAFNRMQMKVTEN